VLPRSDPARLGARPPNATSTSCPLALARSEPAVKLEIARLELGDAGARDAERLDDLVLGTWIAGAGPPSAVSVSVFRLRTPRLESTSFGEALTNGRGEQDGVQVGVGVPASPQPERGGFGL
jgi:hypothetical protein